MDPIVENPFDIWFDQVQELDDCQEYPKWERAIVPVRYDHYRSHEKTKKLLLEQREKAYTKMRKSKARYQKGRDRFRRALRYYKLRMLQVVLNAWSDLWTQQKWPDTEEKYHDDLTQKWPDTDEEWLDKW